MAAALTALAAHAATQFGDPGRVRSGDADVRDGGCRRVCPHCSQGKPTGAHHCRTCGVCVREMDHHCPWVNNCVGRDNQLHFILMLAAGMVASSMSTVLVGVGGRPADGWIVLNGVLFAVFTAIMLMDQTYARWTAPRVDRLQRFGAAVEELAAAELKV